MFSDSGIGQELIATAVAVVAGLYLFQRLTGWPTGWGRNSAGPRPSGPPVHVSRRLARGLAKAQRRN